MSRIISFNKRFSLFLVFIMMTGCLTAGMETLNISVTSNGVIQVEGENTSLDTVGKAVKKAGAGKNTMIMINIAENTSLDLMRKIKSNVAKAGYPLQAFKRARVASASVKDPAPKKEPAPGSKP